MSIYMVTNSGTSQWSSVVIIGVAGAGKNMSVRVGVGMGDVKKMKLELVELPPNCA